MIFKKTNKPIKAIFILFILSVINNTIIFGQELPLFKNGDKVVFIGNSITQDGRYHMILQAYFATRFPGNKVEFYSAGVSGDVADGMLNRFDKDIMIHKPDYAFLMTGMNDLQRYLYEPSIQVDSTILAKRRTANTNYYTKTEKLVTQLIKNGVKPILMTPSIYDQTSTIKQHIDSGCNDALANFAVHIRRTGLKYNIPVVDLHAIMNEIQIHGQLSNPEFTIVGHDRIHPGDVGHFIMASEIINTVLSSEVISKVEIDLKKKKVITSENCAVEIIKKSEKFEFKVLSNALPFPVKKQYKEVLKLIPFQQNFNNEIIKIYNLEKGNYTLFIDDNSIETFTSDELLKGINLANYETTPQYQQALSIFDLCEKYHKAIGMLRNISLIEYRTLNTYTGSDTYEEKRAFLDAHNEKQKGKSWYNYAILTSNLYFEALEKEEELWNEISSLRNEIYIKNAPQWHAYKLIKN